MIVVASDMSYYKLNDDSLSLKLRAISRWVERLNPIPQVGIRYSEGFKSMMLERPSAAEPWQWERVKRDFIEYLEGLEHELHGVIKNERLLTIQRKVGDIQDFLRNI